jgi:hypothetical protein
MLILSSKASAPAPNDAARALEGQHVGAVVVQDDCRVVGILTDRDLMVRVLSAELDARATPLHDVMTAGPLRYRLMTPRSKPPSSCALATCGACRSFTAGAPSASSRSTAC